MTEDFSYDSGDLTNRSPEPAQPAAAALLVLLACLTIVCATIVAVVYLLTQ